MHRERVKDTIGLTLAKFDLLGAGIKKYRVKESTTSP
jgi:hypothetical protein